MGNRARTSSARSTVTVLGVDPGTLVTGFGIVERAEDGHCLLLTAGIIRSAASLPMQTRLKRIYDELTSLMREYKPRQFAIESAFYGKNAQSALKLGQARGAAIVAAAGCGLEAHEYSPREVKLSVVGTGAASKTQVQAMVRTLLHLTNDAMPLDASDATGVALCHLHRGTPRSRGGSASWKAFVAAHPERVKR